MLPESNNDVKLVNFTEAIAWAEAYFHTKRYTDASSHSATTDMGRKWVAVPL